MFAKKALKLHGGAETEKHLRASQPVNVNCYTEGTSCRIRLLLPTRDGTPAVAEWPPSCRPADTQRASGTEMRLPLGPSGAVL